MGNPLRGPRTVLVQAALVLFVTQAQAASVVLQWTAPGDDGVVGTAAQYDLRYSGTPITEENFLAAQQVLPMAAPLPAGSLEQRVVSRLPSGPLWFALRTRDDAGNWSPVSNVAQIGVTLDAGPGPIAEARVSNAMPSPARVRTTFRLALPRQDVVHLEIVDVTGRSVRTLARDVLPAGETSLTWDLRDRFGGRVSPGVYFARAAFLGQTWIRRVIVVQ